MSDTALASQEPPALDPPDTNLPGSSSDADRYDGSRTSPDIQYEIMRRHKADMPIAHIARSVGCDDRTVKAVIRNWGTAQHTLRLQAHRSQVVDCLILGMHSAAEKGKLDSVLSLSDRLGITEPVKSNQGVNVGVQVVLHGGEIPKELGLSPAKVTETSETSVIQAENSSGPISQLMNTSNSLDSKDLSDHVIVAHASVDVSAEATVSQQDTSRIQASKCDVATGGDTK